MNRILTKKYNSPCGTLILASFTDKLCLCDWQISRRHKHNIIRLRNLLNAEFEEGSSAFLENAVARLDEYFTGKRREFDIPLLFAGTDFQKSVWNELLAIPYGKNISYAHLAQCIGKQKAVRAVANAIGANPLSIFVPCHRVIGSNHSLTGYAGGISAKNFLLHLESPSGLPLLFSGEAAAELYPHNPDL